MMRNVFLRSTRRQPGRTVFLLLVMALITFAFVSRGAEYLLVKQETQRLSGYYRAVGAVSAISGSSTWMPGRRPPIWRAILWSRRSTHITMSPP